MHMKKRLLSLLLVLCMVVSVLPLTAQAATKPTLAQGSEQGGVFGCVSAVGIYNSQIEYITFSTVPPENFRQMEIIAKFDALGAGTDNAYFFDNDNNGLYELWVVLIDGAYTPVNSSYLFEGCCSLKAITGLSLLDTSKTTSMRDMFSGCSALEALDLSGFDLSSVTTEGLTGFAAGCSELTEITFGEGWDNCKAFPENMFYLPTFRKTEIHANGSEKMAIYDWTANNRVAGSGSKPTLARGNEQIGVFGCIEQVRIYNNQIESINFSTVPPENLRQSDIIAKFCALTEGTDNAYFLDVDRDSLYELWVILPNGAYASQYSDDMFEGCENVTAINGLELIDTSTAELVSSMFEGCGKLTALDLSGFDLSSVKKGNESFFAVGCPSLKDISFGTGWDNYSEDALPSGMFYTSTYVETAIHEGGSKKIAAYDWAAENRAIASATKPTLAQGSEQGGVFGCVSAVGIYNSQIEYITFSTVPPENFRQMEIIAKFDALGAGTDNAYFFDNDNNGLYELWVVLIDGAYTPVNSSYLFEGCCSLKAITGLSLLDTSKTTSMRDMFSGCSALEALDLSGFDLSSVTTEGLTGFAAGCSELTEITFGEGWDNCKAFPENMFYLPTFRKTEIHANGSEKMAIYDWTANNRVAGSGSKPTLARGNEQIGVFGCIEQVRIYNNQIESINFSTVPPENLRQSDIIAKFCALTEGTDNAYFLDVDRDSLYELWVILPNGAYASQYSDDMFEGCENVTAINGLELIDTSTVVQEKKVVYRIVNGTWADGSNADLTELVPLTEGSGTLQKIPVGMLPFSGYGNGAWSPALPEGGTVSGTEDAVYVYRFELPLLDTETHYAYVGGYEDGTIRPERQITRAEVAMVFYRLLKDEVRAKYQTDSNSFRDVSRKAWYNTAVSTLCNMGILKGYKDGSFRPNAPITRAELAALAIRFAAVSDCAENSALTDISNHWAKDSISCAAKYGWVKGYGNGKFLPNNNITRAEAFTLINNMLNRNPKNTDLLPGMTTWKDCTPNHWYYAAIQEATNSHTYVRNPDGSETWCSLLTGE